MVNRQENYKEEIGCFGGFHPMHMLSVHIEVTTLGLTLGLKG